MDECWSRYYGMYDHVALHSLIPLSAQHAEMPQHRDAHGEKLPDPVGLQLWIDLPKKNKMDKPSYQEYPREKVITAVPRTDQPEEDEGSDWEIKVIAGTSRRLR